MFIVPMRQRNQLLNRSYTIPPAYQTPTEPNLNSLNQSVTSFAQDSYISNNHFQDSVLEEANSYTVSNGMLIPQVDSSDDEYEESIQKYVPEKKPSPKKVEKKEEPKKEDIPRHSWLWTLKNSPWTRDEPILQKLVMALQNKPVTEWTPYIDHPFLTCQNNKTKLVDDNYETIIYNILPKESRVYLFGNYRRDTKISAKVYFKNRLIMEDEWEYFSDDYGTYWKIKFTKEMDKIKIVFTL